MKSILTILLCIPYSVFSQSEFKFDYRIDLKPQSSTFTLKKGKHCRDANSITIIIRDRQGDVPISTVEINGRNGESIDTSLFFEKTFIQKLTGESNYTIKISSQGYTTLIIDSLQLKQCTQLKVLLGKDNALLPGHIVSKRALNAIEIEHIIDKLSKGYYLGSKKSKKRNGYYVLWEI